MNHTEYLCEQINLSLRSLSYSFSEDSHRQKLVLNSYQPVYFYVKSGETAGGMSTQWMRTKHSGGAIHEPGTIAVFDALCTSAKSIKTVFFPTRIRFTLES